jgi:hypothetical protein
MDCGIYLGGPSHFELRGAILVYSGGQARNGAFASWHDVGDDGTGPPRLGPAVPLTTAFLRELSRGLGAMTRPEVLPENVHDDELGAVSGRIFPQPPLLFRVTQRELWIRALADNVRPTASTALMVAPYYNVNTEGAVCQGTMRSPEEATVAAMEHWERAFFESEFTHIYGSGHFTRHPGGMAGLWSSLAGKRKFPMDQLSPAGESLARFVERER